MDIRLILLIITLLFFCVYAILKEYKEHDDCFALGKYRERDSVHSSLRKLVKCVESDGNTVKWRRTLLATTISIIIIFGLVHTHIPTAKELLLYILIIFIVFYMSWHTYSIRTTGKAAIYAKEHIDNIKKYLAEKRRFILPF